jgi:hypothetical protein
MAITSAQVGQPINTGSNALMQLAQILGQQGQFNQAQGQQADQFASRQAQQQNQFDISNRLDQEAAFLKQEQANQDKITKIAQTKYDRYLDIPSSNLFQNEAAMSDFLQAGIAVGQFTADSTFDEIRAVLSDTKGETIDIRKANLADDRFAWDKWKWKQDFDLKLKDSSVSPEDKMFLAQIGRIQEVLMNTPVEDRGKIILNNGWDKLADNFNETIAAKNNWEPINISAEDVGDFKFWTPRFTSDISVGTPKVAPKPVLSAGLKEQTIEAALGGDKDAKAKLDAAGINIDELVLERQNRNKDRLDEFEILNNKLLPNTPAQLDFNPYSAGLTF